MSRRRLKYGPKSHPLTALFDGHPETFKATVNHPEVKPRWTAMLNHWREELGLSAEDVRAVVSNLVVLGVERMRYEERLLDVWGRERAEAPLRDAGKERAAYAKAREFLQADLARREAQGRKLPTDLVGAARALRTLTLTPAPPQALAAGRPGAVWARESIQRTARLFLGRGVARKRTVRELYEALTLVRLADVVTEDMLRRWLRRSCLDRL